MTMPKKGTRTIVVGGETYRFRVNTYDDEEAAALVFCQCRGQDAGASE